MSVEDREGRDGAQECPSFEDLAAYCENPTPGLRSRLDAHVGTCERCSRRFEEASRRAEAKVLADIFKPQAPSLSVKEGRGEPPSQEIAEAERPLKVLALVILVVAAARRGLHKYRRVLVSLLVGAMLPLGFMGAGYAMFVWPEKARFDDFWRRFVAREQTVTVVIPNDRVWLPVEGRQVEVTNMVGTGDAKALGMFYHVMWTLGANPHNIQIVTSQQVSDGTVQLQGPVCVLGGPSANPHALQYMARLRHLADARDPKALSRGFRFRLRPEARDSFLNAFATRAQNEEQPLGIVDVASSEVCRVEWDAQAKRFDPDAALVVRGDLEDGTPVLLIMGYETDGGLAAMKALSQPGSIVSKFHDVYRDHRYAEMVIRTKKGTAEPELFQDWSIQNPRGE